MKQAEKTLIRILLTAIAFISILTAILPASAAEEVYFIICNPNSYVCVRNQPKKCGAEAGILDCGDYILTDGVEKNGFLHVLGITEGDGWVHLGHVVPDRPVIEKQKMRINSNWQVASRKWVGGKKNGFLHNGDVVTVYARSEQWAVTNRGYIMTEFLEVDNE